MLQAQGIPAWIQIGSIDKAITEMQYSDNAWVMAEVSPGALLALETTNGQVVPRAQAPRYYTGWSFDNPAEYKRFEELKYEHNVRVAIMNKMIEQSQASYADYQAAFNSYEQLTQEFNDKYAGQPPSEAAQNLSDEIKGQLAVARELEGRYNQLLALIAEQQEALEAIVPEMNALTN